jgi:hypothetical protein
MDSLPPYFNTGIFNTSAFYTDKDYLTKEEADKLYLSIGSGQNVYLAGITPGLVLGEKCVVPDINKDISGFLNLSAESSINVNRSTNGECYIASNGTVRTAIHCLTNSVHIGTTTNHNFNIQTHGSNVLRCLSTGSVDIVNHNGSTLGLTLNGTLITSTATELNYLSGLTLGTAQANKALVLDANRDITNIRRATFAGAGDIITLYNPQLTSRSTIKFDGDSTSKWELGSRNSNLAPVSTFYLYDNVASQYRIIVDSSGSVNIVNHNGSTNGLKLNDVLVTATAAEINYLDITTPGTAEASKALVLDASRNITNINNLTLNNLIGSNVSLSSANLNNFNTTTTNSTIISPSSFTNQYDIYLRKNITGNNHTLGIAFHMSTNDVSSTIPNSSIICTRTDVSQGYLSFITSQIERLRILETGIVNITSTQASSSRTTGALTIAGGLGVNGNVYATRLWMPNTQFGLSHSYSTGGTAEIITYTDGTAGSYIGTYSSNNFGIATNSTIRIDVDTSGNVNIVNHNGSTTGLKLNGTLITATAAEINYLDITTPGTAQASKALVLDSSRNINNINRLFINSIPSSSITVASLGVNKTGNGFEEIFYCTNGKTRGYLNIKSNNAMIFGTTTPSGESPSHLEFMTDNNVRFRMDGSSGNISIGTVEFNPPYTLTINGIMRSTQLLVGTSTDTASERLISALDSNQGTNTVKYITLGKEPTSGNQAEIGFFYAGNGSLYNALTFGTYGGEKMRMSNNGCLSINTTDIEYSGYDSRHIIYANGAAHWGSVYKNTSTGTQKIIVFVSNTGTEKGSIEFGSGSTSFNTSSDYRLKKDITPLNGGLDLVNKLNPVNFKWKDSDEMAQGFIAHELQEHIPYCVSGTKDAVYDNNSINPQAVDYGKLTTVLVSAVKELTTRLKYLEDFISQLDIEEV